MSEVPHYRSTIQDGHIRYSRTNVVDKCHDHLAAQAAHPNNQHLGSAKPLLSIETPESDNGKNYRVLFNPSKILYLICRS